MENTIQPMSKKDYYLSFLAGLLIGLLFLPIIWAIARPKGQARKKKGTTNKLILA